MQDKLTEPIPPRSGASVTAEVDALQSPAMSTLPTGERPIYGYDLDGAPLYEPPTPPLDPEALPMLVWLRGDEPYCGDFVIEADAVMAELGIKRSRLTQISGRELRVGRMRLGRYIRPVYRAVDVQAYKQWTRATASHVKAASVLQDAAKDLSITTEGLTSEVEKTQTLQRDTLSALKSLQIQLQLSFTRQLAELESRRRQSERMSYQALVEHLAAERRQLSLQTTELDKKLEIVLPIVQLLPELHKKSWQALDMSQLQVGQIKQHILTLQQQLQSLADKVTILQESTIDLSAHTLNWRLRRRHRAQPRRLHLTCSRKSAASLVAEKPPAPSPIRHRARCKTRVTTSYERTK